MRDTAPILVDGTVVGYITFGSSDQVSDAPLGNGPGLGPAPASKYASREYPRGNDVGGAQRSPHATHQAPHRRLGGPHQHSELGRHLDPANREKVSGSDKPEHISLGDVKKDTEHWSGFNPGGGSAYLRHERQWLKDELDNDPSLRRYLGGTMAHEQGPGRERQMVFESLANRLNYLRSHGEPNLTLRDYLSRTGGNQFYGPIRRGQITESLQNQAQAQGVNSDIDAVLGGSNLVRGFTDQGSRGDPNYHRGEYMDTPGRESYNDFGGASSWRQEQQRRVEQGGSAAPGQQSGVTRLGASETSVPQVSNPSAPGNVGAAPGHSPDLKSIDPRLMNILGAGKSQFEALHPGWSVAATSGRRSQEGPHGSESGAVDLQIIDPHGRALPNSGKDSSGLYTELAKINRGEMLARHPELQNRFNWGGYFNAGGRGLANPQTGEGRADLMHYDLEGHKPYRGAITDQYKNLGTLPRLKYGQSPTPTKTAEVHGTAL
jgi:hypothetical protein